MCVIAGSTTTKLFCGKKREGEEQMRAIVAVIAGFMGMAGIAVGGSIDSPGSPSTGSGMYTLSQIYDYLNSGTAASASGVFEEPVGTPAPTMKTTKELYDSIKAKLELCTANPADVKSGVKFFCAQTESWGVQTGTAE
jgi:hypothetical protein